MKTISEEQLKEESKRVIWLSDFEFKECIKTRGRGNVTTTSSGTIKDIVIVGSNRAKILTTPHFMKRAYYSRYGKENYMKRYNEKTLQITKIILKKPLSLSFAPEYN
jgi:hypothetical protein